MVQAAAGAILALLLLLAPITPALADEPTSPRPDRLEVRLAQWPQWRLPAPLPRPGHQDLVYPDWFRGTWQVQSRQLPLTTNGAPIPAAPPLRYAVHFQPDRRGQVVGDRAGNAAAIATALLGPTGITVRDDPANPNRQLARLADGRLLESTVVGRRTHQPSPDLFLADELSLQVLHGPGDPQVSRIETLSRFERCPDGRIAAEQWQMRYPAPGEGLVAEGRPIGHEGLSLVPGP